MVKNLKYKFGIPIGNNWNKILIPSTLQIKIKKTVSSCYFSFKNIFNVMPT